MDRMTKSHRTTTDGFAWMQGWPYCSIGWQEHLDSTHLCLRTSGRYRREPPTRRPTVAVCVMPPPVPVMGREYHRPGAMAPLCVSDMKRVACAGGATVVGSTPDVKLGEGLDVINVTEEVKPPRGCTPTEYVATVPGAWRGQRELQSR